MCPSTLAQSRCSTLPNCPAAGWTSTQSGPSWQGQSRSCPGCDGCRALPEECSGGPGGRTRGRRTSPSTCSISTCRHRATGRRSRRSSPLAWPNHSRGIGRSGGWSCSRGSTVRSGGRRLPCCSACTTRWQTDSGCWPSRCTSWMTGEHDVLVLARLRRSPASPGAASAHALGGRRRDGGAPVRCWLAGGSGTSHGYAGSGWRPPRRARQPRSSIRARGGVTSGRRSCRSRRSAVRSGPLASRRASWSWLRSPRRCRGSASSGHRRRGTPRSSPWSPSPRAAPSRAVARATGRRPFPCASRSGTCAPASGELRSGLRRVSPASRANQRLPRP